VSGFLDGRTGLVVGVANKRSIAWSCAQALHAQGMRLAFSYVNERLEKPVRRLAEELDGSVCFRCDVTKEEEITSLFQSVGEHFGGLDTFVHAVSLRQARGAGRQLLRYIEGTATCWRTRSRPIR
jgi:enoyl-[acyl-carrier protein] reductase I